MSKGLKRLSAAIWSCGAVALAALALVSTVNPVRAESGLWQLLAACAVACAPLHFLTVWVIDGFRRG